MLIQNEANFNSESEAGRRMEHFLYHAEFAMTELTLFDQLVVLDLIIVSVIASNLSRFA